MHMFSKLSSGKPPIHRLITMFGSEKKSKKYLASRLRVNFLFLQFKDPHLEYNYMHQPDYLLKYSVLLSWWVLITLIFEQESNFEVDHTHTTSLISFATYSSILFIIWYKQLCFWLFGPYKSNYSSMSCMLFRFIEKLQRNLIGRLIIYVITVITHFTILADLMVSTALLVCMLLLVYLIDWL